jgi:hypothetical protein
MVAKSAVPESAMAKTALMAEAAVTEPAGVGTGSTAG